MPAATVTIRELKNKDTGIDLSVTKVREVKAMLGSSYEYDITVVSNLSYFKSPKHKESDNVQFVISKRFAEFEDLHSKLNLKFSGTVLPVLPRKVLLVSDAVARERRNGLDEFVRFLAMTPKMSTCALLLEFLGVNPVKAGKFRTMEVSDSIVAKSDKDSSESLGTTGTAEENSDTQTAPEDLFDEGGEDNDEGDLFGAAEDEEVERTGAAAEDTKLFDDPDLGGGIEEGEGDDLFLVEAVKEPTRPVTGENSDEDTEDLFTIDDNLSKLMEVSLKPKGQEKVNVKRPSPEEPVTVTSPEKPAVSPSKPKPAARGKPSVGKRPTSTGDSELPESSLAEAETESIQSEPAKTRPTPAPRPKPPILQKPSIGQKPSVPSKKPSILTEKPSVPKQKPAVAAKPAVPAQNPATQDTAVKQDMGQDDILKYIQDNTAEGSDDLELFS